MSKILIWTPQNSPRLTYTLHIMLEKILGVPFLITENIEEYKACSGPRFCYSPEEPPIENNLWIQAHPLLFEEHIVAQTIEPTPWKEYTLFFPTEQGAFPVDPLAISFYLLTRYEEYTNKASQDQHGRFKVSDSVSYRFGWHRKPMVNILSLALADKIKEYFPDFQPITLPYQLLTTYDVDIAYLYRGRRGFRLLGAMAKSFIFFRFHHGIKQIRGMLNLPVQDPYDRFELHRQLAATEGHKPVHFVLTAPLSRYDRNINPDSHAFKQLLEQLSSFSDIGIHPSYHSSERTELIRKEKQKLEEQWGNLITKSRQHYLKFQFPSTFEALIDAGIKEDYSLGWADEVGFRTGTTIPIPFFNLDLNQSRDLLLVPLHVMDGALYQLYNSEAEYQQAIEEIRSEVKKYGGTLVMLYHSNSKTHLF